jgi:hypothetical protein
MSSPALELHEARSQAPLAIEPFNRWHAPDGSLWAEFHRVASGYLVRFPLLADFAISADGTTVDGWPVPGVSGATVEHLYLNQATPLALSRQDKLVLHAAAVDIDGKAVALVGKSGRGKSTLAASFATHGIPFLTDDGLLVEWSEGKLLARPSHPSIRLWDDSGRALVADASMAPPVDYTSKTRFLAGPGILFCREPRPLHHVYYLGDAEVPDIAIAPVRPAAALLDMVRNSFLLDIAEQEMLALHFTEISRIAQLPIHFRVDYPRSYAELENVRAELIRHTNQEHRPHDV